NPPLSLEPLKQRGVGKWNECADSRGIESCRAVELDCRSKNSPIVMIESEHDASLHRDAVGVKAADDLAVLGGAIVAFVGNVEAGLRDRLQAEEEGLASTPGGEGHEFVVEREVSRALAGPPTFQRGDRGEKFFRPGAVCADVVVPEDEGAA